ncbi:hypothetical protein BDZ89DRAFT_1137427 [Hymenopellis radicata]|nr:hypothetical protein BDZ89DRAFT_1137427 [Hymenopellis radicata]
MLQITGASPSSSTLSPLLFDSATLNSLPEPLGSPYSPNLLTTSLRQLHLDVADSPDLSPTAPRLSKWDHVTAVLQCISEHFSSFGDFAEAFSTNVPRGDADPRSTLHVKTLSAWLGGRNRFRPADFIQALYHNRFSVPQYDSLHADELAYAFDANHDVSTVHYTRIALSIWATRLVGKRCALEVGNLGKNDSAHPDFKVHLQASVNQRMDGKHQLVTQDDVFAFSMQRTADVLQARAKTTWYLTECMAATRRNGEIVVRDKRPHPLIQATAISSFALCRNKSANGYFALPIGAWLFACKAHTDIKRAMSRLGQSVHDSTVRDAMTAMGKQRLDALQKATGEALEKQEPYCRKVLDNIQQYQIVHEPGIGKQNKLITGTAATAIRLDDCEPGAFDLDDYQTRVVRNERATLTTQALMDDVDSAHLHHIQCLHIVRMLCEHVPSLEPLCPLISERFRSEPVAKHRMRPGRKSLVVPLKANSHAEMEVHGMKEAQKDFDLSAGHTPEAAAKARVLLWDGGDGGSVLSGGRVKRHLLSQAVSLDVYHSFENRLWTPGIWHIESNMLNVIAENHYGPRTTKDPSALSRSASATNMHIPTKLNSCNFYPTSKTMRTICEARVLDIWDLHLTEHKGLLPHFESLVSSDSLPSLDDLLRHADLLVKRYMSTAAYNTALSSERVERAPSTFKFPLGPVWVPPAEAAAPADVGETEATASASAAPTASSTAAPAASSTVPEEDTPGIKIHVEEKGFTGDRVLANSILFCRDFLWWLEVSYAVADGDIGRVMEVLKLGKWIEDDLLQEHYNKWLEDMVAKHGGSFSDPYFRDTISPNVNFFLRLKEELELAFELSSRGKVHTSSHLCDERRVMMAIYREDKLAYFRQARSMGHAARELIGTGYKTLDEAKMKDFLSGTTEQARLLGAIRRIRSDAAVSTSHEPSDEDSSSTESDSDVGLMREDGEVDLDGMNEANEIRDGVESSWMFHLDGEGPTEMSDWQEADDGEDGDGDADADVDVDSWSLENDEI